MPLEFLLWLLARMQIPGVSSSFLMRDSARSAAIPAQRWRRWVVDLDKAGANHVSPLCPQWSVPSFQGAPGFLVCEAKGDTSLCFCTWSSVPCQVAGRTMTYCVGKKCNQLIDQLAWYLWYSSCFETHGRLLSLTPLPQPSSLTHPHPVSFLSFSHLFI